MTSLARVAGCPAPPAALDRWTDTLLAGEDRLERREWAERAARLPLVRLCLAADPLPAPPCSWIHITMPDTCCTDQ